MKKRKTASSSPVRRAPTSRPPADPSTGSASRWTFLTNYAHVLLLLRKHPDMVLREVAVQVGITERAVQRIVQDLEEEGFLRREKLGRCNHYEVLVDKPLRHSLEAHCSIGQLLELISPRE